jgi:hypothetical protein
MTNTSLKDELQNQGLCQDGTKDVLMRRLERRLAEVRSTYDDISYVCVEGGVYHISVIGNIAEDVLVCDSDRFHTIVMVELKFDDDGVTGIIQEIGAYPIYNEIAHAESICVMDNDIYVYVWYTY